MGTFYTFKVPFVKSLMKWTIENFEEQNFVRVSLEGDFSVKDVSKTLEDLFSKEYWKPGKPVLFDDTKLNLTGTSLETIREGSQIYFENSSRYADSKIAVLAASLTDFARGRQFELITGNKIKSNIRIFLKEEEAIDWLTS